MRKATFLVHYNSQANLGPSKLLIVADCKINKNFVNGLCNRLNTNADLLYVDTSRITRKSVVARHISYLVLAKQALSIAYKYDNIVFWQQFIGLHWSYLSYLKRATKVRTFLLPLIYKSRRGIIGTICKLFFSFSLSSSALSGAICHSSKELKYYRRIFPKCKSKIFFIPYGQVRSEAKDRGNTISGETPYFFSGGTSNRDYPTLVYVAPKIEKYKFVLACTKNDIKGLHIPDNVRVVHDAYGEEFDSLMKLDNLDLLYLPNILNWNLKLDF